MDEPLDPFADYPCPCGHPRGRGRDVGPAHCARGMVEGTDKLPTVTCALGEPTSVLLFLEQRGERANWPLTPSTLDWWPLPAGRRAIRQWWRPQVPRPPRLELDDEEARIGKGRPPRAILEDEDARIGVAIRRRLPSGASLWLLGLVSSLPVLKGADVWAEPVVLPPAELRTAADASSVSRLDGVMRTWYTRHMLDNLVGAGGRGALTPEAIAAFREKIVQRLVVVLALSPQVPRRAHIARDLHYSDGGLRDYLRPSPGVKAVAWATLVGRARLQLAGKKGAP